MFANMRPVARLRRLQQQRTRTAPSGYSKVRVTFHALRTGQFCSSLIVGSVMSYFMYYLAHDGWPTPWTFVVLEVVSFLTVASLAATMVLHCCSSGLKPTLNLSLNGLLALLWAMGFCMISYNMWDTLTHLCDTDSWHDSVGIMVCRTCKAVYTFSLLGLVSTFAALGLDLYIYRLSHRGGKHYRLEDLDIKHQHEQLHNGLQQQQQQNPYQLQQQPGAEPLTHRHLAPYSNTDIKPLAASTDDLGYDGDLSQQHQGSYYSGESASMAKQGYAVPENQFHYDTGYHGHDI